MNFKGDPSRALGLIRDRCESVANPTWHAEIALRRNRKSSPLPSDQEMMRRFCVAIAFSQGTRSVQIEELIATKIFTIAFAKFVPAELGRCDPNVILQKYWGGLSRLRFRGKIQHIVRCAQVLICIAGDHGSFAAYLEGFHLPRRIRSKADLDQFWQGFNALQADLGRRQMPFFRKTTSLLQLLLDLDYDSIKPDLIVMRLARRTGIVERENGDRALRKCVRFLQEYSVENSCRAAELDLAMLAFGGQTRASRLLIQKYCPPKDPCEHAACPLGANCLCMAYKLTQIPEGIS